MSVGVRLRRTKTDAGHARATGEIKPQQGKRPLGKLLRAGGSGRWESRTVVFPPFQRPVFQDRTCGGGGSFFFHRKLLHFQFRSDGETIRNTDALRAESTVQFTERGVFSSRDSDIGNG